MKRPSGLTLVTAILLVLLPALAVLQYQWVGRVSAAERDRMQRNLTIAAFQFRQTFDGELAKLSQLRVGPVTVRDANYQRYADKYDGWLNVASHPRMVAAVYLIDADGPRIRLRRWVPDERMFEDAEWPPDIAAYRPQFERERRTFDANPGFRPQFPVPDDSLLVAPVSNFDNAVRPGPAPVTQMQPARPPFGFTVIQLNLEYIAHEMLPELTQRHFTHTDSDVYRVAVTTVKTDEMPSHVIYRSDADAPTDVSHADATESLYADQQMLGRFLRGPRPSDDAQLNIINVVEGQNGSQASPQRGRWRLLVQHQSGSLEAAVGEVRRRNLAISFGVLLLLSFSVAMLTLASRRAERLAKQQMEFVAGISHELRTPVAVIKSAAENLSQGVVGSVDRVKRYGNMIEGEARRLAEMVERVLQYAAIESGMGMGSRTALAPQDIIQGALDSSMPILAPENIKVQRDIAVDLPAVVGDASALRSAVQNLIANAVKYGGSDKWVGIRAEHVPGRRHGDVRITISDHGDGIPPAELPHIFEPFYRGADAVSQQIHGNGLGLSLVRRIVEAHGGKVSATSRAGGGSAFTIMLPAADEKPATMAAANELTASQS
jgi:signal transduction histidine kinase